MGLQTINESGVINLINQYAPQPENTVVVNKLSQIKTEAETRITFKANTLYRFGAKITHAFEADFEDGAVLEGASNLINTYEYTGTGTAFNSNNARWIMRNFGFSVPNGTAFNCSNGTPMALNFVRIFEVKNVGAINGGALSLFDFVILDVKTQGLVLTGNFLIFAIRENFHATTSTGVNLMDWYDATFDNMEIANYEAIAPSGSFVIRANANSVNINSGVIASIRDSNLSTLALGNSLTGGITPDDDGYNFKNSTVIDSKVIGHCYVTTPLTTTIIQDTEVPINGVFTQGDQTSQAESTAAGVVTTRNRIEKRGNAVVDLDVDKIGGGTVNYIFRIKKIPISTGIVEDIDGGAMSIALQGGGSANLSISAPTRFIDGDQFQITVEGDNAQDIDLSTQGFYVTE